MRRPHTLAGRSRSETLLIVSATVTVLVCCVGAFVGLGSSSLWVDELFSAYFADRAMPDASTALRRAAEDVNPPGFYMLLWGVWRTFGGDFEITARAFSAVLGCVAALLVALAPPRNVPLAPRLVGAALATASYTWFFAAQEARSYALSLCLVTGMVALTLRCIPALRAGRAPWAALAMLGLASCSAIFVHYYALMIAGGLFTVLLAFARSIRRLVAVGLAGLLTLGFAVVLVTWHQPQIVVDIANTWFSADPGNLASLTRSGIRILFFEEDFLLISASLAGCMAWAWIRRAPVASDASSDAASESVRNIVVLSLAAIVAYVYALVITIAYTPILGARFFHLLAPLVWVSASYGAWFALAPSRSRAAGATAILLAVAIPVQAWDITRRDIDSQEPWRHSAAAVTELEGCVGAALPVLWWEQPYFSEDDPERFYGFYMPDDPDRTWVPVSRWSPLERLADEDIAALVRETASGARRCPLLLWAARSWRESWEEEIVTVLKSHLPQGEGAHISVETVPSPDGDPEAHLLLLHRMADDP